MIFAAFVLKLLLLESWYYERLLCKPGVCLDFAPVKLSVTGAIVWLVLTALFRPVHILEWRQLEV